MKRLDLALLCTILLASSYVLPMAQLEKQIKDIEQKKEQLYNKLKKMGSKDEEYEKTKEQWKEAVREKGRLIKKSLPKKEAKQQIAPPKRERTTGTMEVVIGKAPYHNPKSFISVTYIKPNGAEINIIKDAESGKFWLTRLKKEEQVKSITMQADAPNNPRIKKRKPLNPKTTKKKLLKDMIKKANFSHKKYKKKFEEPEFIPQQVK